MPSFLFVESKNDAVVASRPVQPDGLTPLCPAICIDANDDGRRRSMDKQAKHANGESSWGVDGNSGKIVDMNEYGLWESASVKVSFGLFD